jgi:hypothetical protein
VKELRINNKFDSPRPNAGEGLGARGTALLRLVLAFAPPASIFGVQGGMATAKHLTPNLSPLRGGEGANRRFFTASGSSQHLQASKQRVASVILGSPGNRPGACDQQAGSRRLHA